MDSERYTIGQIAEICNIPAKQLRYYDETGVISPHYRDPVTQYRYYGKEQIEELLLLQELKSLDFPLKDIGKMLERRELRRLRQKLEARLYDIRSELSEKQRQYDSAVGLLLRVTNGIGLTRQTDDSREIGLTEFESRTVLFTRYRSPWNANHLFIRRRAELYRIAKELGLTIGGVNLAVFHSGYLSQFSSLPEDQEGDLEVCLSVLDTGRDAKQLRRIPAFQAVTAVHIGHYRDMKETYLRMEAFSKEHGCCLANISVEEYLVGATMTDDPADYVTRLYIPLRGQRIS